MKNILVSGGAGYIGSHAAKDLKENGYSPIILDNLCEGHIESVKGLPFEKVDLNNLDSIRSLFDKHKIDAVMHFAAYTYVGESVVNPAKYYQNNVAATLNLLSAMLEHNVKKIIFSSTCATYGEPKYIPIDENHPQNPINPYGKAKFMVESILKDYDHAYGLKYIILRYFNASGACRDASIGESHNIETHLIPLILKTLTGEREHIKIFGTDYNTPDGTCIRDYIHVEDLARAHRLSLEKLMNSNESFCINLGSGIGNSVKEIITACEQVTGMKVPYETAPRREGDPAVLVASNQYAEKIIGFKPNYTDIKEIIKTAWQWEQNKKF